jgi:nucleotide-binding universal stress UspA family protein
MGSRGHGAIANLALGSTTAKVLAAIKTPVLIVR